MSTEVRTVTENILCLRRASYLTCSYMVRTGVGLVLVDAGMSSDGADVRAGLDRFGAAASDIRAILLTHWHNDHSAGAQVAQRESGAKVFFHAGDDEFFTGRKRVNPLRAWLSEIIPEVGVLVLAKGLLGEAAPRPISATEHVRDGQRILDEFTVIETGGHTPGHVSYFYAAEKALFAGDALAVVNGQLRYMARPVTPDQGAARASLLRCLQYNPEIICPGHREPMTQNVKAECERMIGVVSSGGKWPLFG